MQFTTAIVIAFTVVGISAAPAPNAWQEQQKTPVSNCPNSSDKQYCCSNENGSGFINIDALNCVDISVFGNSCNQQIVCCSGDSSTNKCTTTSGSPISVPILWIKF